MLFSMVKKHSSVSSLTYKLPFWPLKNRMWSRNFVVTRERRWSKCQQYRLSNRLVNAVIDQRPFVLTTFSFYYASHPLCCVSREFTDSETTWSTQSRYACKEPKWPNRFLSAIPFNIRSYEGDTLFLIPPRQYCTMRARLVIWMLLNISSKTTSSTWTRWRMITACQFISLLPISTRSLYDTC